MKSPFFSITCCVVLLGLPGLLEAQQADVQADQRLVFELRYASVEEATNTLLEMFDDRDDAHIRIVALPRLQKLIVSASKQAVDEIREIIDELDQEAPVNEREVRVFNLAHIEPDRSLMDSISLLLDGQSKVSIDPRRGEVVAVGSRQYLEMLEALLIRLDRPTLAQQRVKEQQVRLVWLVSGLASAPAQTVPKDLGHVVNELAKIGVSNLKMVAQLVVNTVEEHVFTTSGIAQLNEPCRLQVSGAISELGQVDLFDSAEGSTSFRRAQQMQQTRWGNTSRMEAGKPPRHPKLQLAIFASKQDGEKQICELKTTIQAPIGQSVVLAVTPLETMTSVFVIQVRPIGQTPAQR